MKKILSILMILVLVGGVVFAQDAAGPTVSGGTTLSWGIDLGSGKNYKPDHGFLNASNIKVSFPLVGDIDPSKGEGDVYADLSISNAGFSVRKKIGEKNPEFKGTDDPLSAKASIHFYGAYLTVFNAPNMATTYAHRAIKKDDKFKTGLSGKYGTKIGYKYEKLGLDVGLKFVSNGSWKDKNEPGSPATTAKKFVEATFANPTNVAPTEAGNYYEELVSGHYFPVVIAAAADVSGRKLYKIDNVADAEAVAAKEKQNGQYGMGLDFEISPIGDYLTVKAGFNMSFVKERDYQQVNTVGKTDDLALGFGLELSSKPVEGLSLTLGFDGGTPHAEKEDKFAWALGFGTEYAHEKAGTVSFDLYVASKSTPFGKKRTENTLPVAGTDMAVKFGYKGLTGLVPGLTLKFDLGVYHLLGKLSDPLKKAGLTADLDMHLGLAYEAKVAEGMTLTPYTDLWGKTNQKEVGDGAALPAGKMAYFGLIYKVGVKFSPLERVTVDLNWSHGELDDDDNFETPCQYKADNGQFVISTTVTY